MTHMLMPQEYLRKHGSRDNASDQQSQSAEGNG